MNRMKESDSNFGERADMKSLDHWSIILRYFLLPFLWFLSFSRQFSSACTVKMNMILQRSRDFMSGRGWRTTGSLEELGGEIDPSP